MPAIETKWLGRVEWEAGAELLFPVGIPGFERERRMIPVEIPEQRPLVYLQSVSREEVCFMTLPVRAIDADFRFALSEDDRDALQVEESESLEIGENAMCLAVLSPAGEQVRTNLRAPIVINLRNMRCVQSLQGSLGPGMGFYQLGPDGCWRPSC